MKGQVNRAPSDSAGVLMRSLTALSELKRLAFAESQEVRPQRARSLHLRIIVLQPTASASSTKEKHPPFSFLAKSA